MAQAFLDLQQVLRSKKEILTREEADIILSCKAESVMDFTTGALTAGAAAWAATWKLSKPFRINLSAGVGAFCGLWIFSRSLCSCAEKILTMENSILKHELATIMVTKYQNDPSTMQLISKHFYLERIFDDSTSNNPKLRWRYRNFFGDNAVHGHRTHGRESNDKSQEHSHNDANGKSQDWSENVTHSKRTNLETKHTFENADIMSEGDPLNCLFGYAPPVEDIHQSNSPNKPSGIHNRARRRSHRRRRVRNQEDLSNSESPAAV